MSGANLTIKHGPKIFPVGVTYGELVRSRHRILTTDTLQHHFQVYVRNLDDTHTLKVKFQESADNSSYSDITDANSGDLKPGGIASFDMNVKLDYFQLVSVVPSSAPVYAPAGPGEVEVVFITQNFTALEGIDY